MKAHKQFHDTDATLAEFGGESLADSGFENDSPDFGFVEDSIPVAAENARED